MIDWTILAVVVISVLAGIFDGFVKTVLSFVGVLAAFFLSPRLGVPIGDFFEKWMKPQVAHIAGFVGAFALVLVVFGLLTWILRKSLDKLQLNWIDRLLGGALGFFRAAAILGLLAVLADATGSFAATRASKTYPLALQSGRMLLDLVPDDAKERFRGRVSGKGAHDKGASDKGAKGDGKDDGVI